MKKRIVTLVVFLLITCLTLTACGTGESFAPEAAPAEGLDIDPDPAEMYSYEVGGVTIRLKTRVEDYLTDEKEFRFNDLTADLGWYTRPIGGYTNPGIIEKTYDLDDDEYNPFLYFETGWYKHIGRIIFGTIRKDKLEIVSGWHLVFYAELQKTGDEAPAQMDLYYPGPSMYFMYLTEDRPQIVYFSEIVIITYILENYMYNMDYTFFDGMYEKTSSCGWTIYE